jgi:hypothetical protein
MNKAIRWRIMTLQATLTIVLAFVASFGFYIGTFVQGTIHDQLSSQQIYFPDKSTEVPGGALDPAVYPKLQGYAGLQVNDGNRAYMYATYFLGHHLTTVFVDPATGKGMTYSQAGTYISANSKTATPQQVTQWQAQRTTLFTGEMLKTALLNSWGWWQVATYTIDASYGLALAALAVFGSLLFEIFVAPRVEKPVVTPIRAAA